MKLQQVDNQVMLSEGCAHLWWVASLLWVAALWGISTLRWVSTLWRVALLRVSYTKAHFVRKMIMGPSQQLPPAAVCYALNLHSSQ